MIEIYGMDNNTVIIEADSGNTEEIEISSSDSVLVTVQSDDGGVDIEIWYRTPSWCFLVSQLPNEVECPWDINLSQDSSYSMRLTVECESDVKWKYEVV